MSALEWAQEAVSNDEHASKDDPPTDWLRVAALALVSIAESQAALVDVEHWRCERDRMYAEEFGEMFPDRPVVDTPPL